MTVAQIITTGIVATLIAIGFALFILLVDKGDRR